MTDCDDMAQWRQHVFSIFLPVVLALGTILTIPSFIMASARDDWEIAILRAVVLVWVAGIWRVQRASYVLRVLNFLAALFLLSIGLLAMVGPASLNYLMAPPIAAVMLFGMRSAAVMLALCAASLLAMTTNGVVQLHVPGMLDKQLSAALLTTLNFLCIGTLVTVSSGTLLKGLARSLAGARRTAAELGRLNHDMRLTSEALARLNDLVLIARSPAVPGEPLPIIFANDAAVRHTGYAREDIIGSSVRMFEGPDTDPAAVARLVDAVQRKQSGRAEMLHYKRNGDTYWVDAELVPFADEHGAVTHWVVVGRDITEQRNTANAIHRLAYYDGLTGLPNRRLLLERLATLLGEAADGRIMGALLYIDLDNFKTINDARGHAAGDLVLTHAADRLGLLTGPHDTVARLGGDEFVVLLGHLGTDPANVAEQALARAETIRRALSERMDIEGQRHFASASIGVTIVTHGGQSVHDLLREGDIAMYQAKRFGRNGVALFASDMLLDAERKLALERGLALALDAGELALHLQLQFDRKCVPVGIEMLMRWRRQDGTLVTPDVFIPVAESSGLILTLGEWALREACLAWHALDRAGQALPVSVNVSPVQFRQPDFVARVEAILRETGVPPGQLIFEITEGLLVDRIDPTIERMHALRALGIRFSIDDFGTGYSSLAYLTRMPLYELKIDKSFIQHTPQDRHSTAIVQSVLAMANHLGLRVVAEGVETRAQAEFLTAHGNACMQGHLFHHPMPLDEALRVMTRMRALA